MPAQCQGSSIDLTAALADEACRVGEDFAPPVMAPDAIVLSVEPAKPVVKRGARVTLQVVFENRSDRPQALVFRFSPSLGFGLGGGSSPRQTDGFSVEARLPFSESSLDEPPGPTVLGARLTQSRARVELAPGGRAVAAVSWQAVGFMPGKRYRPRRYASGAQVWVPEPLPRGTYTLTIHTPLEGTAARSVTTMVLAEVTR